LWKVNELLFEKCQVLLSQATTAQGSPFSPLVFSGEMEVAACFPESNQNEGPSATRQFADNDWGCMGKASGNPHALLISTTATACNSYVVPRPTINTVCLFQTGTGCFDD